MALGYALGALALCLRVLNYVAPSSTSANGTACSATDTDGAGASASNNDKEASVETVWDSCSNNNDSNNVDSNRESTPDDVTMEEITKEKGEDRCLLIDRLFGEIENATFRKKADKIIITLKKKEEKQWTSIIA